MSRRTTATLCDAICDERYAPRYSDTWGYAGGYIECNLPKGHDGWHRFTYEWKPA